MWWSEQAKRILRLEPDAEPDIETIVACFVDADRSQTRDRLIDALEDGESFETDVGLAVEGTTERYVRLRAQPQQRNGGLVTLYGTVEDVTDAKRQEKRIQVLRRTSQELREANSQQAVAEIIAETSKNILGYVNATVRLAETSSGTLRTVAATEECIERAGKRPDYPISEKTPAARTYRTGEPELHTDHRATEDDRDRGELRSGLYVPIGDHGVLSAGDVVVDAFDERDIEAASLLGQLGAKAITRIGWTKRSRAI
nr:GAF domain-containing protein [Natronococcus occultus]